MSESCVFQESVQSWCILSSTWHFGYQLADTNIWNQDWAEPELRSLAAYGPMWHRLCKGAQAGHSVPSSAAQTPTPRWSTGSAVKPLSVFNARQRKENKKKIAHTNTHSLVFAHQNIQSRNIAITCIRWNTNRKSVVNVINVLMSVCTNVCYVWELLSENDIIKCVLRWLLKAQSLIFKKYKLQLYSLLSQMENSILCVVELIIIENSGLCCACKHNHLKPPLWECCESCLSVATIFFPFGSQMDF